MISLSHFFAKAPASDEAGHIGLHTEAHTHVVSHLLLNLPKIDRIDPLFAVNALNVKCEANGG